MLAISKLATPPGQESVLICAVDGKLVVLGAYTTAEAKRRAKVLESAGLDTFVAGLKEKFKVDFGPAAVSASASAAPPPPPESAVTSRSTGTREPSNTCGPTCSVHDRQCAAGGDESPPRTEPDDQPPGLRRVAKKPQLPTQSALARREPPTQSQSASSRREPLVQSLSSRRESQTAARPETKRAAMLDARSMFFAPPPAGLVSDEPRRANAKIRRASDEARTLSDDSRREAVDLANAGPEIESKDNGEPEPNETNEGSARPAELGFHPLFENLARTQSSALEVLISSTGGFAAAPARYVEAEEVRDEPPARAETGNSDALAQARKNVIKIYNALVDADDDSVDLRQLAPQELTEIRKELAAHPESKGALLAMIDEMTQRAEDADDREAMKVVLGEIINKAAE